MNSEENMRFIIFSLLLTACSSKEPEFSFGQEVQITQGFYYTCHGGRIHSYTSTVFQTYYTVYFGPYHKCPTLLEFEPNSLKAIK